MKRLKTLILVFSIISLMSCTTSKSVVSKTADIRKYEYVTITDVMGYNGSPSLMDAEIHIYDALEMSGLKSSGIEKSGNLVLDNRKNCSLHTFPWYRTKRNLLSASTLLIMLPEDPLPRAEEHTEWDGTKKVI